MRFALVLLPALTLLAACAGAPTRTNGGLEASTPAALDALYERVDAAAQAFADAVAQGESGASARESARLDLQALAARCAAMAGCSSARVFGVYDRLLESQSLGDAAGESGFEAADAHPQAMAGDNSSPVLDHLPQAGQSINLLAGRELREVIELNGPVKAALNEWLTWMRPNLIDAWENYQYMRHLMWPEYERAGLPEALLFGILAKESGGRVHAISRAGATGPLQFMYATGQRYGLGQVNGFDTRFDPQLSARANVLYLNDRFAEFNHNLELALAAYNGGEGRMLRLHRSSGGKPFWHPDVFWQLPAETRDYVPMVLAAAWLFLHPEDYGLEFPRVDTAPSEVRLTRAMSINELSICIGNNGIRNGWFRHLRNLNPRWEAHAVIPAGTVLAIPQAAQTAFDRHCQSGGRAELAAQIAASRQPAMMARSPAQGGTYTVRKGDTLNGIVRKMGCRSVSQLAASNNLRAPHYFLREGQKLTLTGCSRS